MREKISEELVYRLADELVALGIAPTNAKIRERNGNYGSPNDIQPYLKKWKDARHRQQEQDNTPKRPMPDNLTELFMPLWLGLNGELDRELVEKDQAHEREILEKDQEIAGLNDVIRVTDQEREALQAQVALLNEKLSRAEGDYHEAEKQLYELNTQVIQQKDRIDDLKAEVSTLKEAATSDQVRYNELQQEHGILQHGMNKQADELEAIVPKLEALEADKAQLTSEREDLNRKLSSELAKNTEFGMTIDQLKEAIAKDHDKITRLETQLVDSQAMCTELSSAREEAIRLEGVARAQEDQLAVLNKKVDERYSVREYRDLKAQHDQLAHELKQGIDQIDELKAQAKELSERLKQQQKSQKQKTL